MVLACMVKKHKVVPLYTTKTLYTSSVHLYTKKQKQLRASIAHARTFRYLDSVAESGQNSTPASTTTPSLRTEDPAHPTPPASPGSGLNDGLDVIEEESEQLLEDYGGNYLPGTIEAVTRDAKSQDKDDVTELQGEELLESLRCQMEAEITLKRQLSKEGLEVLMRKIDAWEWQEAELKRSLGYNGLSKRTGRHQRHIVITLSAHSRRICPRPWHQLMFN